MRRGHGHKIDPAVREPQTADEVAALHREPDVPFVAVEDQGVRIARRPLRHLDLLDLVRGRVIAADMGLPVAGIPDDAVAADDQVVGARTGLEIAPHELAGLGVEAGEVVAALADEPDFRPTPGIGIARPAGVVGHRPLVDRNGVPRLDRACGERDTKREGDGDQRSHVRLRSIRSALWPRLCGKLGLATTGLASSTRAFQTPCNPEGLLGSGLRP